MPKTEQQLREDIVQVGRLIFDKGWVAANDGNITIRLDDERLLATPTGVSKGMMRPEDMIVCNIQGDKLCGERNAPAKWGCTSRFTRCGRTYAPWCMRIRRWPQDSPPPAAR